MGLQLRGVGARSAVPFEIRFALIGGMKMPHTNFNHISWEKARPRVAAQRTTQLNAARMALMRLSRRS